MNVKLLLMACIALSAVLPPAAQAVNKPEVTYPTGTKLETNKNIQAVNVGEPKVTWGGNTITCTSSKWKGTLKKNTGTEVEADVESATFNSGGECTTGALGASIKTTPEKNGTPWCLRSTPELADTEFQIRGGKCSGAVQPIGLVISTTQTVVTEKCIYEQEEPLVGTYQTHPNDAVFSLFEAPFNWVLGSFVFCSGGLSIDAAFTFERAGSGPIYISAGPRLTFPTGTTLAVSNALKGTATGTISLTGSFTTSCSGGELTGTLRKNTGTEIQADIEGVTLPGCGVGLNWTFNGTNGLPWCLEATSKMAADEFQIRGNRCSEAARPIRYTYEKYSVSTVECKYERAAALAGSYATHSEDAVLSFKQAVFLEVEPRSSSCPDEAQLDYSMTLEDESASKPLYIS
ncbi:MAG TPA: hypothetical protein VI039_02155 [Solirubrobacterales bacterium]